MDYLKLAILFSEPFCGAQRLENVAVILIRLTTADDGVFLDMHTNVWHTKCIIHVWCYVGERFSVVGLGNKSNACFSCIAGIEILLISIFMILCPLVLMLYFWSLLLRSFCAVCTVPFTPEICK